MLLADGASDLPLATHLRAMCLDRGHDVAVSPIAPQRFPAGKRSVEDRLRILEQSGDRYDLAFIHRDAEGMDREQRSREIEQGVRAVNAVAPWMAVIPVRMTEAWLLLDAREIRLVAGRPNGREDLDLPPLKQVEKLSDPKEVLRHALLIASAATGRRRARAQRDFSRHRELLLQRLDRRGPVTHLSGWQALVGDLDATFPWNQNDVRDVNGV